MDDVLRKRPGTLVRSARHCLIAVTTALLVLWLTALDRAGAETHHPVPGTVVMNSSHSFQDLRGRLEEAVMANDFAVVTRASASAGAEARGVSIPGNLVVGVFRNDYAVRMLEASVPAGIEVPLRFYVTENPDGTATLTYRKPTAIFAPYGVPALDAMAAELDPIWQQIAEQAVNQ
jgi:uncharacterized protein (DUF302 family)